MKHDDDVILSGNASQSAVRGQTSEESPLPTSEILRFAAHEVPDRDVSLATRCNGFCVADPLNMTSGTSLDYPHADARLGNTQSDKRDGLARIAAAFAAARAEDRAALMPYFTLGYPDIPSSEAVVRAVAAAGADLIELGVPFSDPLADGPTIQHSTQVALEQGVTVAGCLEIVVRLRAAGLRQPLLLMGYVNPILAYGITALRRGRGRRGRRRLHRARPAARRSR